MNCLARTDLDEFEYPSPEEQAHFDSLTVLLLKLESQRYQTLALDFLLPFDFEYVNAKS